MDSIASNVQGISLRIAHAEQRRRMPSAAKTTLIAVSKTMPEQVVRMAIEAGQIDFGENYVQEGVDKIAALRLKHPQTVWHMIGALQSNKTRLVATHFDWVHTVDRLKLAQRLSEQRPPEMPDLNCLIQVNIDDEASKAGVQASEVIDLARTMAALPRITLRGLMCIPLKDSASAFQKMADLIQHCLAQGFAMDTLSMGMSADFESAIEYGATHVRVGAAIFGARR